MTSKKGIIAIMGSGELTPSMVSVHKLLIQGFKPPVQAVFLDTPAGFQLNVDQLSKRACDYFKTHIQQPMSVASFKSSTDIDLYETEKVFQSLRNSDYFMIGPGSPTYAVRHWKQSPIPEIFIQQIERGSCLVAASAAALTLGRFTLPVYEIYKVGEALHWVEGLNILGHFGLDLVVIPHWNNAEGGTHDTRFCYMGEPRFRELESLLPEEIPIMGLDEHTACIVDLEKGDASVMGIGRMTIRFRKSERTFEKGERFSLDVLRGLDHVDEVKEEASDSSLTVSSVSDQRESFWEQIHSLEEAFKTALDGTDAAGVTNALLELDKVIWEAQGDLESAEFISQARDVMRELMVLLGVRLESMPSDNEGFLSPLMESLLEVREELRKNSQWELADKIRKGLARMGIIVEDTKNGSRWRNVHDVSRLD
jgi:peptidase E